MGFQMLIDFFLRQKFLFANGAIEKKIFFAVIPLAMIVQSRFCCETLLTRPAFERLVSRQSIPSKVCEIMGF